MNYHSPERRYPHHQKKHHHNVYRDKRRNFDYSPKKSRSPEDVSREMEYKQIDPPFEQKTERKKIFSIDIPEKQLTEEDFDDSIPKKDYHLHGKIYHELRDVGHGGFGDVKLVRCESTGQKLAIKIVQFIDMDEEEKELCRQEATVLRCLDHPNIIHLRDVVYRAREMMILMEYADGGDLSKQIRQRRDSSQPFTEQEILGIIYQIALGLAYIHSKHIIHRDIKPQNILIVGSQYKIADLGIAKVLEYTGQLAESKSGTKSYMAPEILRNEEYSTSVDIWSFGVMCYELCQLKRPFDDKNTFKMLDNIGYAKFQPISKKRYSIGLIQLIDKMLQVDPSQRYTIQEILSKLQKLGNKLNWRDYQGDCDEWGEEQEKRDMEDFVQKVLIKKQISSFAGDY